MNDDFHKVIITLANLCCIYAEDALYSLYFASTQGEDESIFLIVGVGEATP